VPDDELAELYGYPDELDRPWVRMNFVASADGAAAAAGLSAGLSSAPDRRVFGLLRGLAEVILVGAGTVRAENYRGARTPSRVSGVPPRIAVVTGSARLDPTAPLFTDTAVPPLILTGAAATEADRRRLVDAGAEVVATDGDPVTPGRVLAELDRRGLRRVLCEGGPRLFGQLLAADAVDELCLTVSPMLAGGGSGRIADGPDHPARAMRLAGALAEDGVLLLRYLRDR
jgi:5-amino-6-(5-phosphoribosylamino)uracil reductase